jgi:hypothetical protein
MVKERPILFSGPMVRALIEGRKTQTRRAVKAPIDFIGAGGRHGGDWDDPNEWGWEDPENPSEFIVLGRDPREQYMTPLACPYGQAGDRLWVRETWRIEDFEVHGPRASAAIVYRADGAKNLSSRFECDTGPMMSQRCGWRSPIHMPRMMSRITLEIVGVRAERLQGISEKDAWAEGFPDPDGRNREYADRARYWYRNLWDEINGKRYPWASNPWVWVLEFKVIA